MLLLIRTAVYIGQHPLGDQVPHFGIKAIGLYGSYAKNHASPDTDIDLFFLPQPGVHIRLEKRIQPRRPPLEDDLAQLLRSYKIDLVNYRYLSPIVRNEVEKSIIYIFG